MGFKGNCLHCGMAFRLVICELLGGLRIRKGHSFLVLLRLASCIRFVLLSGIEVSACFHLCFCAILGSRTLRCSPAASCPAFTRHFLSNRLSLIGEVGLRMQLLLVAATTILAVSSYPSAAIIILIPIRLTVIPMTLVVKVVLISAIAAPARVLKPIAVLQQLLLVLSLQISHIPLALLSLAASTSVFLHFLHIVYAHRQLLID